VYNFLSKVKINEINITILLENYLKILIILNPVIPHFSSECINELHIKGSPNWPTIDKKTLQKKTNNIVIQLNGKKRGIITCEANIDENIIINLIKSDKQFTNYFKDKTIKKTIYVKDRLINLILE
jgi:leucyl-tRNA synthetase